MSQVKFVASAEWEGEWMTKPVRVQVKASTFMRDANAECLEINSLCTQLGISPRSLPYTEADIQAAEERESKR